MKLTEQRCPACNGTLKIDEKNPHVAVCEYCKSRYILEWENGLAPIGNGNEQKAGPKGAASQGKNGRKKTGRLALLVCCAAALAVLAVLPSLLRPDSAEQTAQGSVSAEAADTGGTGQENVLPAGILADFCQEVFGQPVEAIPPDRIRSIQWLEVKSTMDYHEIGYSVDNPMEDSQAQLTWVEFDRDAYGSISLEGLSAFSGLKKLTVSRSLRREDLKGLKLESIGGYFASLEETAGLVENPEELREVRTTGSQFSLQGIDKMPKLESLSIDGEQVEEMRLLVQAEALKKLSLDLYDGSADFSVFSALPGLEELAVSCQNLKDISFVSNMENLKSLELEYGTFLDLEPLRSCQNLERLWLLSCDELKDLSVVETLTGLRDLGLEVPYGCGEPNLGGLTELKKLYLGNFSQTGFLQNLSGLEELTLDGCRVDDGSAFAGLTSLKTLTCTSFGHSEMDYSFVASLPALETLDLEGMVTYGDISGIFNMPSLKSLDISYMECEIDFDRIQENQTLEELYMDSMTLYENVSVSGSGAITYVDWDEVDLKEHLDFLGKLKGLKVLSIRENELTDLGFVSPMTALTEIDFGDNYVTDLTPLAQLPALKEVNCQENPISNYEVLGDSVKMVRDSV